MVFSSLAFIFIFLPLSVILYSFKPKKIYYPNKLILVICCFAFYAYWKFEYIYLLFGSILFNYLLAQLIFNLNTKRIFAYALTLFGVAVNIAVIGYYKYFVFLVDNYYGIFTSKEPPAIEILLPLGISFFTFQQIAYLVDVYSNKVEKTSFFSYCLFVSFFPQIIAGPIVYHAEMMPQFDKPRPRFDDSFLAKYFFPGVFIFLIGLFKKVAIADLLSGWVTRSFMASSLSLIEAWTASLSYTFQIYFDFSGYCDMAIGAALLFGIKLPINFNSPYKALDIQDFWRRWHITLSRWLRNYIYIPLGGNRRGMSRELTNIFITFLIGGLWHGAAWTFVLWGMLHGIALVIHRVWNHLGLRMNRKIAWILTFLFVNFAWVLFRADSFANALMVYKGMFGLTGISSTRIIYSFHYNVAIKNMLSLPFFNPHGLEIGFYSLLFVLLIVVKYLPNSIQIMDNVIKNNDNFTLYKASIFAAVLFGISLIMKTSLGESEFLYFNF